MAVPSTVAIVLGRKGSQSLPGKNTRAILGRPAVEYPLMAATHSRGVEHIVVSTDDERIREIALRYGAIPVHRPPELSTSEALLEDAIQDAYARTVAHFGGEIANVVLLLANAPNILAGVIDEGVRVLDARPEIDSAITASKYNMFHPMRARRLAADGTLDPYVPFDMLGQAGAMNCDRGSGGDAYFADGGMTVVRGRFLVNVKTNLLPFRWMGHRIFAIFQRAGGGDVDELWQVPAIEHWLREQGFSETSTPYDHSPARQTTP